MKIETFKPHVILLDVYLGTTNGLEICVELKTNPKTKKIPVIIFSAHINETAIMDFCKADDFIAKLFDIQNLLTKINLQLNSSL